jgi:hypothetical protein
MRPAYLDFSVSCATQVRRTTVDNFQKSRQTQLTIATRDLVDRPFPVDENEGLASKVGQKRPHFSFSFDRQSSRMGYD